jgi:hypothetical protein
MAELVVQVSPKVAQDVREDRSSPELEALHVAAAELGIELEPQVRGTRDEELSRYFTGLADDEAAALDAAQRLSGLSGVSAAYPVPPTTLPSDEEVGGDDV